MISYLLDSDVIIDFLAGKESTVHLVKGLAGLTLPACSALTVIEVKVGLRPREAPAASELFQSMVVLPVDLPVAEKAWQLMREWREQGQTIHLVDACIAATCLVHDLALATNNRRHFPMDELSFIKV